MPPRCNTDEETPLLDRHQAKKQITPLPWSQFSIVLFLQLAEPLTSNVIYPFAPQLIREIGVTHGDETQVGYYVGFIESLFYLTQAFTILYWSRVSDSIGRKPVILCGLFGLSFSMYCFGLSRTFWGLVLSRSLNGALNGNIGVIKSAMVEMTDATNISRAFAYTPIAWSTGGTLGPLIGGLLSRPAERFPQVFGDNEFLKKFPYFLPCAVPATVTAVSWVIASLYLKETVANPVSFAHFFNLPKWKAGFIRGRPTSLIAKARPSHSNGSLPLRALLTPRVVVAASNYAALSLIDIALRAIQPLFYSTPVEFGGLGLPPSTIGWILAAFGIIDGVAQMLFFTRVYEYWGPKKVFVAGVASAIPTFVTFPIISILAKSQGLCWVVWALVALQVVISIMLNFSYGAIWIYVSASPPTKESLGATNGLSQMSVSFMRAVGPALASSLFSLSIEKNYLGGHMVYYVLLILVSASIFVASFLPQEVWTS